VALAKGFLEEADFEKVGVWQTKEEKEKEEKTPRDTLPLHCQRAIVLTTSGAKARIEKRKRDIEEEKENKRKKKEKKKAEAEYAKRVSQGWQALKRDIDTGAAVRPKQTWQNDSACFVCKTWYGAWQEAELRNEEFAWLQCCGCDEWVCPYCIYCGIMKAHEPQCKAERDPQKSLQQAQRNKRKRSEKNKPM
jgi:hypothetical protein